ncbi:MAG: fatty acid desaturase [Acidobacteria bacterium]|nr:fatty acid desaturase [Acidobacteriota bacterium]
MKIWKHSHLDVIMLALSIAQAVTTLLFAIAWNAVPAIVRTAGFVLLVGMTVYNIIVVSHLFTHAPWFRSPLLNRLVSMLNSINIGQSVQAYELMHVRNHHRYNNDQQQADGKTQDLSSTYRDGIGGEHVSAFRYAFVGAIETCLSIGRALMSVTRFWRVGPRETELLPLFAKSATKRAWELRQVQLDRLAHCLALCLFVTISWQWVLLCYLPAIFLSLAVVNVQNYYEHYGAAPANRYANSVSYYGLFYNLLTFNDGYHQEHHLRPLAHWTQMPRVRREYRDKLERVERIISPVPAILGAFHRNRELLHRSRPAIVPAVSQPTSNTLSNAAAGR